MKIRHLETLVSGTPEGRDTELEAEIMQTYCILMNALSCLASPERWMVVDKLEMRVSQRAGGAVTSNATKMTRVALKMSDIKKEYEGYVDKKQRAVAQNFSIFGF